MLARVGLRMAELEQRSQNHEVTIVTETARGNMNLEGAPRNRVYLSALRLQALKQERGVFVVFLLFTVL